MKRILFCVLAGVFACSASSAPAAAPAEEDAAPAAAGDAGADASGFDTGADAGLLTGKCADSFGSALTEGFGRLDGVVFALQMPNDQTCAMPNRDHLIVQVLMNGAVYRMVVNVESDRAGQDPRVRLHVVPHALPAPPFAEGWHTGLAMDYATTLGAHADSFTPYEMDVLVAKVSGELAVGAPVSVYAFSGAGRPSSAHLIHRNGAGDERDGLIVVGPDTPTPKMLLFAFDGQTF